PQVAVCGRTEPRCAIQITADSRDCGREIQAAFAAQLQRHAHLIEFHCRGCAGRSSADTSAQTQGSRQRMTFNAKPKVAHPSLPKNKLGLTRREYEGALSTLCAGCGHDSITAAIVEASWELSIEPQNLVKLSGIGCSSKTTAYFVSGGH